MERREEGETEEAAREKQTLEGDRLTTKSLDIKC